MMYTQQLSCPHGLIPIAEPHPQAMSRADQLLIRSTIEPFFVVLASSNAAVSKPSLYINGTEGIDPSPPTAKHTQYGKLPLVIYHGIHWPRPFQQGSIDLPECCQAASLPPQQCSGLFSPPLHLPACEQGCAATGEAAG